MTTAHERPDLVAYTEAARMASAELVAALRPLLGNRLVAVLGHVKETRAVRQWSEGTRKISKPEAVRRLRIAIPGGAAHLYPRYPEGGAGVDAELEPGAGGSCPRARAAGR